MTTKRKEINDLGDEIINVQENYRRTSQGNGAQRRKLKNACQFRQRSQSAKQRRRLVARR